MTKIDSTNKMAQPKGQVKVPIVGDNAVGENARVTDEEKEVIRQAVYKATTNGWTPGAFILMQFAVLNVPFIFHSFFSDSLWAQNYFGKDWIEKQHEMLTVNQSEGTNAVITFLKNHNTVIEKAKK